MLNSSAPLQREFTKSVPTVASVTSFMIVAHSHGHAAMSCSRLPDPPRLFHLWVAIWIGGRNVRRCIWFTLHPVCLGGFVAGEARCKKVAESSRSARSF